MTEFLFATEHVQTSQGWFLPGHLMPKLDLPEEETLKLLEEKKAAFCAHDSPLAQAVHDSRKLDQHAASVFLKGVMETLSPMSPGDEPLELDGSDTEPPGPGDDEDDDWVDPTPKGEFPTPENFVRAGYKIVDYESSKTSFFEAQTRMADEKAAAEAKALADAAAKAEAEKKAAMEKLEAERVATEAAKAEAEKKGRELQTVAAGDVGSVSEVLGGAASESSSGEPTESK